MKKITLFYLLAVAVLVSCAYRRVGSMTMISTRNIDSSKHYVLLARGVEGVSNMKNDDALQDAIDNAVHSVPGGEYMMNTAIYFKDEKRIKVRGDVYGIGVALYNDSTGALNNQLQIGDKVTWRIEGTGSVIGLINEIKGDSITISTSKGDQYSTHWKMAKKLRK